MDGDMMVGAKQKALVLGCFGRGKGKRQKAKIAVRLGRSFILPFHFCLLPFALHSALAAELLPDPTRPPLEAGLAGDVATLASGPVLQSVKIAPGRRMAVISGQLLAQGERFGAAKLVSISESEVVLLGPEGRQTLKLFPAWKNMWPTHCRAGFRRAARTNQNETLSKRHHDAQCIFRTTYFSCFGRMFGNAGKARYDF